jgi:hypothetical protein
MSSRLDANQIVQNEHDPVTNAKKVTIVNADFAIELSAADGDTIATQPVVVDTATMLSASASSNITSSSVNCLNHKVALIAIEYSGLTGTLDGSLVIENSLDNTLFFVADTTALSAASGSKLVELKESTVMPGQQIRARYTANGVSGGALTVKILLKA